MPYTVTIAIAAPGTPMEDKKTSLPGHMWYSISDGREKKSYGFAPIEHGSMNGKGEVSTKDDKNYHDYYYQRTMEISKEHYDKLKEFGEEGRAKSSKYFDLQYKDARNNCVDFTWSALNHAGLHIERSLPLMGKHVDKDYEGSLKPVDNARDVDRIPAPFPNSPLNQRHLRPMPKERTLLQHLLSEQDSPVSPDKQEFVQQTCTAVNALCKREELLLSSQELDNLTLALANEGWNKGMDAVQYAMLNTADNSKISLLNKDGPFSYQYATLDLQAATRQPAEQSLALFTEAPERQEVQQTLELLRQQERGLEQASIGMSRGMV